MQRKDPVLPRWLALTVFPHRRGSRLLLLPALALSAPSASLLGLTPLDARRIVGTDLAFGLCLSLIGGILHLSSAGINSALLINLIIGGVLGGLVGTGLASRIPVRTMRLALSLWLFVMGLQLCWHALA